MRRAIAISDVLAWPFLLPGNLACRVLGLATHRDLFRMLINSIFWTLLGVLVVVLAT